MLAPSCRQPPARDRLGSLAQTGGNCAAAMCSDHLSRWIDSADRTAASFRRRL